MYYFCAKLVLVTAILGVFLRVGAYARPVSYPGGTTVMLDNNGSQNSALIHYSPTSKYSIGYRAEYDRVNDFQMHSAQLNNILKRINKRTSQANIYAKSGVGYAIEKGNAKQSPAAFTGISADWEDRRFYVSYQNKYVHAGNIVQKYTQSAKVGIAPYIAKYGGTHTWFMLQFDHNPTHPDNDHFVFTPLVRLFYDTRLIEAGFSSDKKLMINFIRRF